MAKVYEKLSRPTQAEEQMRIALKMEPNNAWANLAVACLLLKSDKREPALGEAEGLLQKAKSLLEKADTPANRSLRVHLMLSTAAFFGLSGHADDARNMVSEVLNHDKDNDYAKELLAALGH